MKKGKKVISAGGYWDRLIATGQQNRARRSQRRPAIAIHQHPIASLMRRPFSSDESRESAGA